MIAIFFIAGVMLFFIAVRYGLLIAYNLWLKKYQGKGYLFLEGTIANEVLTDEVASNAFKYLLTTPVENIKTFVTMMLNAKNSHIDFWPDWVYSESIPGDGTMVGLAFEARKRKDYNTALTAMVIHCDYLIEFNGDISPFDARMLYDMYMNDSDMVEGAIELMIKSALASESTRMFNSAFNVLSSIGMNEEAMTLIRNFNRVCHDSRPFITNWRTDDEFSAICSPEAIANIVEAITNASESMDIDEQLEYAKNNYVGLPALIATYAFINNGQTDKFTETTYDYIYEFLTTERSIQCALSYKAMSTIKNCLIEHYKSIGDYEKVAFLTDFHRDNV